MENEMEPKELTPEQKKKVLRLHLKHFFRLALFGGAHGLALGLANIGTALLVQYLEVPESFIPFAAFINVGFVVFSLMRVNKAERDRFDKEIQKITSEEQIK